VRLAPLSKTAGLAESPHMIDSWNPADVEQVLGAAARLHSYAGFLIWLLIGTRYAERTRRTSGPVW